MPQLNPSPWFAIFCFSWLVFLTIIVPKVLAHSFPNDYVAQETKTPKTETWSWPWY